MPRLSLHLFGAFQVYLDDQPLTGFRSDKSRALLAYLVSEHDRGQRRESLAGLFWSDYSDRAARRSLSSTLANLRTLLAPLSSDDGQSSPLTSNWQEVAFTANHETVFVDLLEFDRLLARSAAHPHRSITHCASCIERLTRAVALYQGPFLAGLSLPDALQFDEWQRTQAQNCELRALTALNTLTHHHIANGELQAAERYARQQIAIDDLREAAHRQLMTVLAATGQRSAALAQYENCRQTLLAELGAEPEEETTALYEELLAGGLNHRIALAASPLENPYKGLKPFCEGDAPDYYGREAMASYLVDVLGRGAMVGVVGPSGSGKTSLIYAGLLHQLAEQTHRLRLKSGDGAANAPWLICQVRPGNFPFSALAAALAQTVSTSYQSKLPDLLRDADLAGGLRTGRLSLRGLLEKALPATSQQVLIICDQFEELFTLCPDREARSAFLDLLAADANAAEPASWLTVLVTLRADFMGQLLLHRSMADALQGSTVVLGPMNQVELEAAIVQPARAQGVEFQDGLVTRLLSDVGHEAGRLPLLQFCLTQLWERQQNKRLTHQNYDAIGGVGGALTRYADEIYATFTPEDKQAARRVLTQMVRLGVDTEDTRRPVARDHLDSADWGMVQRLADARLVVTDRDAANHDMAEIVHEALIQSWDLLRSWIDSDRTFYLWHQRARLAAAQWDATGHDAGALLRGAPLLEALDWSANKPDELGPDVAEFIATSKGQQAIELAEKEARLARDLEQAQSLAELERQRFQLEARANRRLRWLAAGLAVAALLALLVGVAALRLQRVASEQTAVAQESEADAEAARRNAEEQATRALSRQLAAQAINLTGTQLDLAMLLNDEALKRSTPEDRRHLILNLHVSPLIETHLYGHQAALYALAISNDSQTVASGAEDGAIKLWSLANRSEITEMSGAPGSGIRSLAFSPDDRLLASGDVNGMIRLWDARTGEALAELSGHAKPVNSLVFSQNGNTLRSSADDGTSRLWDLATDKEVTDEERLLSGPFGMAISPAGDLVAARRQLTVTVQSLVTDLETAPPMVGHSAAIHDAEFSPDGSLLATASFDGLAILWDLKTGQPLHPPLEGHDGRVLALAFSPDGKLLASGGTDGKIILWDVASGTPLAIPGLGHGNWVRVLRFTPDGQRLISGDADGTILVWDTGLFSQLMGHENTVRALDFSPDGRTLASGSFDSAVQRRDLATGDRIGKPMRGHQNSVIALSYSPDGKSLVSGSAAGDVVFWDAATGQQLAPAIQAHDGVILGFAFSPDGQSMASVGFDGTVKLWDVASMSLKGKPLTGHEGWSMAVAYSPDGSRLASTGADATVRFWDATTGKALGVLQTGDTGWVTSLAFSPDGKTLVTGSMDELVRLWDVDSMTPLGEPLAGHMAGVWTVAFNPADGGRSLVTADNSGTVIWWDVATRQPLAPPLHGGLETERIALSRDGNQIAIANFAKAGTISLWRVGQEVAQSWEKRACRIANRNLTAEEWQQYLGDLPYEPTCSGVR